MISRSCNLLFEQLSVHKANSGRQTAGITRQDQTIWANREEGQLINAQSNANEKEMEILEHMHRR